MVRDKEGLPLQSGQWKSLGVKRMKEEDREWEKEVEWRTDRYNERKNSGG